MVGEKHGEKQRAISLQGACPRCTRALDTASQSSAGARAAQRPRRRWWSSSDAVVCTSRQRLVFNL